MSFDPSQIKSVKNFEMYQYWEAKRGERPMPARADLDPADLRALLPHILIHEVQREPLDFKYRLVGSEIVRHMNKNPTGEWISSITPHNKPGKLLAFLEKAVTEKTPVLATTAYVGASSSFRQIEEIILPLSIDGEKVNMLFICVDYLRVQQ